MGGCYGEPVSDGLSDSVSDDGRLERAPVEEEQIRHGVLSAGEFSDVFAVAFEKDTEMPGDRGLFFVGETELRDAGTGLGFGGIRPVCEGEEAFEHGFFHFFPRQHCGDGVGDEFAAGAGDDDLAGVLQTVENGFLGLPALVAQGFPSVGAQGFPSFSEPHFQAAGQGEIHVVAAENEMVAHGDAFEPGAAFAFAEGDEGEVRGAAAHVADEYQVVGPDVVAPSGAAGGEPAVEGGQRFLEEDEVAKSGHGSGLGGEVPGDLVEGRGDGDDG